MYNTIFVQNRFRVERNYFSYRFIWANWYRASNELRAIYGNKHVVATDIKPSSKEIMESGPFEILDIMDQKMLYNIVKKYKITQVYLLAAMLSANAEKNFQ